ncbi:MAG: CapA family protein [Rhodospirillales bacterium]|nr:CapA family protein [Rhodospirillales bacterium]
MAVSLFLCGDVMTGRGIDQILPHPAEPTLFEPVVRDAREYVALAERRNGPIPRPVKFSYIWGDTLAELGRRRPAARIVNLETSITVGGSPAWKQIHYRMGPGNLPCLTAARLDCCVLANNHVLDWGPVGLADTLRALSAAQIATTGAGMDEAAAAAPAAVSLAEGRRLLAFAYGLGSAGVSADWAAKADGAGVNRLDGLSPNDADKVIDQIGRFSRPRDLVVVSLHWGSNWGYEVSVQQRAFARRLIESGAAHLIHGHSSHHFRPMEIWRGKLILYGCGDFINDYEGISGYEEYRGDLALMYFPTLDPDNGTLRRLEIVPMRIRQMRLRRAGPEDRVWLCGALNHECGELAGGFKLDPSGVIRLFP